MLTRFAGLGAVALSFALAACGSPPADKAADTSASPAAAVADTASAAATTAAADAKPAAFAQCAACHSTEKGKMGIGPSLAGIYGTKSGDVAGYAFSDAMKGANLTWDDATLDKYLTAPAKVVPGTKMTFAGLSDPAARQQVIEYLKTLK
ncbi:MAG: c-type cytochrome [Proteobacteria bacterium]|nr:c-type cytochrome [Pseudomonadota bacterium]